MLYRVHPEGVEKKLVFTNLKQRRNLPHRNSFARSPGCAKSSKEEHFPEDLMKLQIAGANPFVPFKEDINTRMVEPPLIFMLPVNSCNVIRMLTQELRLSLNSERSPRSRQCARSRARGRDLDL